MVRRELVAYGLIALGALALLARLTEGAGWLWLALVAVALLAAYVSQRTYGLLVAGSLLAGTSVGLLLQQAFPRCDGVFLVALGIGIAAVDAVEPREPRWWRRVGLGVAAVGVLLSLANSGVLGSTWFALALIAVGALLLWRRRESASFPPPLVTPPAPTPTQAAAANPPASSTPTQAAAANPPASSTPTQAAAVDADAGSPNGPAATDPDEASR